MPVYIDFRICRLEGFSKSLQHCICSVFLFKIWFLLSIYLENVKALSWRPPPPSSSPAALKATPAFASAAEWLRHNHKENVVDAFAKEVWANDKENVNNNQNNNERESESDDSSDSESGSDSGSNSSDNNDDTSSPDASSLVCVYLPVLTLLLFFGWYGVCSVCCVLCWIVLYLGTILGQWRY